MPRYTFQLEPSPHEAACLAVEEHPHRDAAIAAAKDLQSELARGLANALERLIVMDEGGAVVCDLLVADLSECEKEEY